MHTCTRLLARARTHSHTHSRFSAALVCHTQLTAVADALAIVQRDIGAIGAARQGAVPQCQQRNTADRIHSATAGHQRLDTVTPCKIEADRAVPKLARNSWRPSAVHGQHCGATWQCRRMLSESHRQPLRPSQRGRSSWRMEGHLGYSRVLQGYSSKRGRGRHIWRMEGHRQRDHCDHRGTPVTSKQHTYPRLSVALCFAQERSRWRVRHSWRRARRTIVWSTVPQVRLWLTAEP
jgi:hypothetical protein